jgi:hypothetical protein
LEVEPLSERKEILNILRFMWRNGDSSLRRIYPSWEDLETNLEIIIGGQRKTVSSKIRSCPHCGVKQKITRPLENLFPYETCQSCKRPFHVNYDLNIRKLTEEEKDNMPIEWVRILEDFDKKKLAIVFRLE